MTRGERGFTLAELLVVMILTIPLCAAAAGLAATAIRGATRAAVLAAAESAVATAAAVIQSELGEVAAGGDLLLLEPARIRIHAARGVGQWCRVDSAGVVVASADWAASRAPVPGRDSLVVERVAMDSTGWRETLRLPLSAALSAEECAPSLPGVRLPADLTPVFLPGLTPGPLVRTSEVIEIIGYVSGGDTWLGIRHLGLGTPVEPVVGPFAPAGVRFEGLDQAGTPTGDPAQVRAVRVRLVSPGSPAVQREVVVGLRP